MPYNIMWLNEKRVILETLSGTIDVDEATKAAYSTAEFIRQGEAPVHLIVDVSGIEKFPANVRTVRDIISYFSDPKLGWVVLVGANPLVNFVSTVASQVVNFQLSRAETVEEAVTFVEKRDATLTGNPAAISGDRQTI